MLFSFSFSLADDLVWGKGFVDDNGNVKTYINENSVRKKADGYTEVWVKQAYLRNYKTFRKGQETLMLFKLDCKDREIGMKSITVYERNQSLRSQNWQYVIMEPVIPTTTGDIIWTIGCILAKIQEYEH